MSRRKNYSPERIIGMLREAEVRLSRSATVGEVCRSLGVSEQSYPTFPVYRNVFTPPTAGNMLYFSMLCGL